MIKKDDKAIIIQAFASVIRPLVGQIVEVIGVWNETFKMKNGLYYAGRNDVTGHHPSQYDKEEFWVVRSSIALPIYKAPRYGLPPDKTGETYLVPIPECHLVLLPGDIDALEEEMDKLLTI